MRLLLLKTAVIAWGCACSPAAEAPPVFVIQREAEVRALLVGVWKLESIDGQPAQGWLSFTDNERGRQVSVSLKCGTLSGTYTLQGNRVMPELWMSAGPDCDAEDLATSRVRMPELLLRPFQVSVSQRRLVARGRDRPGRPVWARYVRSSAEAMLTEFRTARKQSHAAGSGVHRGGGPQ